MKSGGQLAVLIIGVASIYGVLYAREENGIRQEAAAVARSKSYMANWAVCADHLQEVRYDAIDKDNGSLAATMIRSHLDWQLSHMTQVVDPTDNHPSAGMTNENLSACMNIR